MYVCKSQPKQELSSLWPWDFIKRKKKMDESAIFSRYEFDYQADFTQFLEEARKSASQNGSRKEQLNWEKKNRKSWKNSLFSWLKNDKKSKSTLVSQTTRGHVSGPVEAGRVQRALSGPLIGFFSSTRRPEGYEVPYMCLGQLNNHQRLQSYGPVYLVT